jgi:lycopene beta-cyclase
VRETFGRKLSLMTGSKDFDFIIAGAGAAGLSLAYRLPKEARVLLIDRDAKTQNDRTWCFWEAGDGPFEAAVYRRWDNIYVHGDGLSERFKIAPYQYKMLRGLDFYNFMHEWLKGQSQITVLRGNLERLESDETGATAWVDGKAFHADWAFNSALRPEVPTTGYYHLLQHFKGWIIRSPEAVFDTTAATFMDFRTPQAQDTRFVYVLPLDAHTALVEYTLFSPALLSDDAYDTGLREYIKTHLHLTTYEILETEFGIIPMTDAPFPRLHSPRVINTGIAGGRAKASTGYTFQRLQRQADAIVKSLLETGSPLYPVPAFNRHDLMDSIYLSVLLNHREPGSRFFTELFRRNDAVQVLKFLDESSTLLEDFQLMSSVNIPVFTRAALEVIGSRVSGFTGGINFKVKGRTGTSPVPTAEGRREGDG